MTQTVTAAAPAGSEAPFRHVQAHGVEFAAYGRPQGVALDTVQPSGGGIQS